MEKKRVFKYFFLLLTLVIFQQIIPSNIIINNALPLEYQYLIHELEEDPIYKKDNDLIKKANKLNDIFSKLSDDQLFYLIKTTLYKKILNFSSSLSNDNIPQINELFTKLKQKEKEIFDKTTPFHNWLLSALLSDIEKATKEGLVQQKDRKIVFPLANLFILKTPEELKEIFRPLLIDIHQTIELQSLLYISLTQQNLSLLSFTPFTFKGEDILSEQKKSVTIPSAKIVPPPLSQEGGEWRPQR